MNVPLPALRAFLDGRRAYWRARYTVAADDFDIAVRRDTSFGAAALQLARVADRMGDLEREDAALARAWPYRAALSGAAQAQLLALAGPNYPRPASGSEQLDAWVRAARAAPRRAGSWYELGARLTHDGRRLGAGNSTEQAMIALNHALVLDPGYQPARDLLAQLAMRAPNRLTAPEDLVITDSSSALASFLRWRAAIEQGDSAALVDLRGRFSSMGGESLRAIAMASQFDAIGWPDGTRAIQALVDRASTREQRVDAALAAHSFALNTGHFAAALEATNRLRELRPDSHAYLRLRVLDALYGGGDSAAGAAAAHNLGAPMDSLFRNSSLGRGRVAADACVLGQWRLARGDTTDVRAMIALLHAGDVTRADQLVTAVPGVCGDLVDAALAVATGRPDALARVRHLDGLVLTSEWRETHHSMLISRCRACTPRSGIRGSRSTRCESAATWRAGPSISPQRVRARSAWRRPPPLDRVR